MTAAPNNDFADAYVITSLPYTSPGDPNIDNTLETGEVTHGGHITNGVQRTAWWKFVSSTDQEITVDSHGSIELVGTPFADTVLAVYSGTTLTGLTLVGWNDDFDPDNDVYTSQVTFDATAGTTYYFQLGQFGFGLPSSDLYVLNVVGPPFVPTDVVSTIDTRRGGHVFVPLPPGDYSFTAVTVNTSENFSTPIVPVLVTVTDDDAVEEMPVPSPPTVTPVAGGIVLEWSGSLAGGALFPDSFERVEILAEAT